MNLLKLFLILLEILISTKRSHSACECSLLGCYEATCECEDKSCETDADCYQSSNANRCHCTCEEELFGTKRCKAIEYACKPTYGFTCGLIVGCTYQVFYIFIFLLYNSQ